MKVSKNYILPVLFIFILFAENTMAIPAFARKYKISCSTCHTVFPKLKPYGDEFAGSGFIIKEKEDKRNNFSAGDDDLWLSKDFPLAGRIDMFTTYDQNKSVEKDFQIPWGIKLLSGGSIYKNIGYYFYFYLSERGEVAGIEDAYIHFDDVFESGLDIMVGQFQTSDPLMKRELRLTYEDYMIYKTNIGQSNIDLAYDRGIMLAYGIEQTGTDLVAMIVNGNGKGEAVNRKLDQDEYKNYGFRINQAIGEHISVGGFFYKGKEEMTDSNRFNEATYYGPDLNINYGPVDFTAQYLFREDTNPDLLINKLKHKTDGFIAELNISPFEDKSKYVITALYNKIDSDNYKYETASLSFTYMVARNLRLLGEYTRDLNMDANRVAVGVITAF